MKRGRQKRFSVSDNTGDKIVSDNAGGKSVSGNAVGKSGATPAPSAKNV